MSDRRREKEALEIQVDLMFYLKGGIVKEKFEEFKSCVGELDVIQPFYLEKCTTFEKLFRELAQRQAIKLGEYSFLTKCLRKRELDNLVEKVEDYEDKINNIFGQASNRRIQQRSVQPADDQSLDLIQRQRSNYGTSRSTEIPNHGGGSKKQTTASVLTDKFRSLHIRENTQRRDFDSSAPQALHPGQFVSGGNRQAQPSVASYQSEKLQTGCFQGDPNALSQTQGESATNDKLNTGYFERGNISAQPLYINFDRVGGEENTFAQPSDTSSSSENPGQFIEIGERNSKQPSETTGSSVNKLQTGNFDNVENNSAQPLEAGSSSDERHTGNVEREQSTSTQPSEAGSSSDKLQTGNFERFERTSAQPSEAVSFSDKLQTGNFEGVPVERTPTQPTSSNPYSNKLNTGSFEGGSTSTRSSDTTTLSVKQQTGHLGGGESTSSQSLPRSAHTNKPNYGNIKGSESMESPAVPEYPTADPRGLCIIINNIKFTQSEGEEQSLKDRPGSEVDQKKLEVLFKKLKFNVRAEINLTARELMRTAQKVAYDVDHTNYGCLVFCILSHGAEGRVYGTDGRPVVIRSITEHFNGINCDTLRGKPKIFFIQACQGDVSQEGVETDTHTQVPEPKHLIPNESDFLIGYSTPPGFVSYRHTTHGSWYITKLVEKLEEYNNREDLQSILTMVNEEVSKRNAKLKSEGDADLPSGRIGKQSAMHVSLLRKKVFWKTQ